MQQNSQLFHDTGLFYFEDSFHREIPSSIVNIPSAVNTKYSPLVIYNRSDNNLSHFTKRLFRVSRFVFTNASCNNSIRRISLRFLDASR